MLPFCSLTHTQVSFLTPQSITCSRFRKWEGHITGSPGSLVMVAEGVVYISPKLGGLPSAVPLLGGSAHLITKDTSFFSVAVQCPLCGRLHVSSVDLQVLAVFRCLEGYDSECHLLSGGEWVQFRDATGCHVQPALMGPVPMASSLQPERWKAEISWA